MSATPDFNYLDGCPVCAGSARPWRVKLDNDVAYRIERCRSCGFGFVNPRPTLRFLMRYYDQFGHSEHRQLTCLDEVLAQERAFPNSTLDATRLLGTADRLLGARRPAVMLDVGCGYGFYSRAALDRGISVDAIELASTERRIAAELTGVQPAQTSFEAYPHPGPYDLIVMSQILEHAHDVNGWLAKCRGLLRDGGILVIALPNFSSLLRRLLQERDPWVTPPAHLNYFSSSNLSTALLRHGLRTEACQFASRVRPEAVIARLPGSLRSAAPVVCATLRTVFRAIDAVGLGMMLTVYARKVASP